jgi:FimV-like protein
VPKKAKKEYVKADDKLREGDIHSSLEHLRKAVEIDPEFMEAHNNLGARYLMLGEMGKAHDAFKRALELDPHSPLVQVNMAIVLLALRDARGAETAARRSMELDPSDLKSKYILGLALYTQQQYTQEAVTMLSKAQERFPGASIALAYMHTQTGNQDLARKSLKEYLRSGNKEHKQKAEALLASLQ